MTEFEKKMIMMMEQQNYLMTVIATSLEVSVRSAIDYSSQKYFDNKLIEIENKLGAIAAYHLPFTGEE